VIEGDDVDADGLKSKAKKGVCKVKRCSNVSVNRLNMCADHVPKCYKKGCVETAITLNPRLCENHSNRRVNKTCCDREPKFFDNRCSKHTKSCQYSSDAARHSVCTVNRDCGSRYCAAHTAQDDDDDKSEGTKLKTAIKGLMEEMVEEENGGTDAEESESSSDEEFELAEAEDDDEQQTKKKKGKKSKHFGSEDDDDDEPKKRKGRARVPQTLPVSKKMHTLSTRKAGGKCYTRIVWKLRMPNGQQRLAVRSPVAPNDQVVTHPWQFIK